VQTYSSGVDLMADSCCSAGLGFWRQQLHLSVFPQPLSCFLPLHRLANLQLVYRADVLLLLLDIPHPISHRTRRLVHLP